MTRFVNAARGAFDRLKDLVCGETGHFRAVGWLLLAAAGALVVWLAFGGVGYLGSWAGACAKAASGAFGGYWMSKNVIKTNPSARDHPHERVGEKLARAIVVAACVIGVCLAV